MRGESADGYWRPMALAVLVSIAFRCLASVGPYSGQGKPPMYGDYEAQRHWMEITVNLKINEWYVHSNSNDLMYWGLDYPPLTAYHSWAMGKVAAAINGSWVELHTSRGLETPSHKLFMRCAVLVSDLVVFLTACLAYVHSQSALDSTRKVILYLLITLYPGYLLVDFCHFQFNCVSLGLFLWSVFLMERQRDVPAAVAFVCALSYKQMELYHAPAVFFYLLGKCLKAPDRRQGAVKFAGLAAAVLGSSLVLWWPFLGDAGSLTAVLRRLFPVQRGLYEDKVANFWCSLSVLVKLRRILGTGLQVMMCAVFTMVGLAPGCVDLIVSPTVNTLHTSLLSTSLSFFLFSYQVHEKSILLVATPALLWLRYQPTACFIFLIASVFSLFPLCVKDNTVVAFLSLTSLYFVFISDSFRLYPFGSITASQVLLYTVVTVGTALCVASVGLSPPVALPDIFPMLVSIFACTVFGLFYFFVVHHGYKSRQCSTAKKTE